MQRRQHKVSLQFRNVGIQDVLKTLAKEGGINIVASKGVQGAVTIFADSLSIMEAISFVVETQGYAYYLDRGVVRIVTAEEYMSRFGRNFKDRMQTRVVKLHYANVEKVVKTIFQMKSKDGKVIADQRSNSLIVVDLPAVIQDMETVVRQVDIPMQTFAYAFDHIPVQTIEEIVQSMASGGGKVKIDPSTNQLLVIDAQEQIERIKKFVQEADVPSAAVMEIYSLQYADPEAVANRVQNELTPGVGSVVPDKATKKLFIKDLPENLPYLKQLIQTLDRRTREVLIEAKIIQINLNDEFKMGVDWQALFDKFGGTVNVSSNFRVLSDNDAGGRVRATDVSAGSATLNGIIEALQSVGKTDLLSNPRITCTDGQEAYILVGSTVPYKTIDTREDQGGALRTFEKVVTVEVGVKLRVTPHINDEGFITMKIRPEVSEVTSFIDNVPVIEKSESETTVVVKNGVTIIIGGLIKDQQIKIEKRVPLLGSIPLIGFPFRSKSHTKVKTELVILLRPQIITGDVNMKPGKG
ncbi:MAG: secretin N-terminal domain-containing protein [bacterium]